MSVVLRCPKCRRRVALYDEGAIRTATAAFVMDGSTVVVTIADGGSATYPLGSAQAVTEFHGLTCCGALFNVPDMFGRARAAARRGLAAITLEPATSTE